MSSIIDSLQSSLGRIPPDWLKNYLGAWLGSKLPRDYLTARLESAAGGEICPICAFGGGARHIWLWSFIWENVNDPDAREEFIKAGGLCRMDSWSMVEVSRNVIKSTMGAAILFQHLAKIIVRALRQGRSSQPWIDVKGWQFDIGRRCQPCAAGKDAEGRSGQRLALASIVSKRPPWLPSAFPLCRDHFLTLIQETSHTRAKTALASLQTTGIEGLAPVLEASRAADSQGRSRLEASLFSHSRIFPVPPRSESLYQGAIERCPICENLGGREEEMLETSGERAMTPGPVDLCLGHYRALVKKHVGLDRSILPARLGEEALFLEAMTSSKKARPGDSAPAGAIRSRSCPLCQDRAEAEKEIVQRTVQDLTGRSGADDLLCIRHLGRVAEMMPEEREKDLVSDQVGRLDRMIKELGDFIALHDYRYEQQPAENPDAPYRWALRFFTSEPSLASGMLSVGGAKRFLASRGSARPTR